MTALLERVQDHRQLRIGKHGAETEEIVRYRNRIDAGSGEETICPGEPPARGIRIHPNALFGTERETGGALLLQDLPVVVQQPFEPKGIDVGLRDFHEAGFNLNLVRNHVKDR